LELSRKKKQDALRTKLLLREAKNEIKSKIEFLSFVISNKRTAEVLLENFASSKNLRLPFTFDEKEYGIEIKIDVMQLLASELLELQTLFKL
jgi:hypothetical protein